MYSGPTRAKIYTLTLSDALTDSTKDDKHEIYEKKKKKEVLHYTRDPRNHETVTTAPCAQSQHKVPSTKCQHQKKKRKSFIIHRTPVTTGQ